MPPRRGDVDGQLEGYLIALRGATHYALDTTVEKIIRGEVPDISRTFSPSPPELSKAIRDEMASVNKQIELAVGRMELEDKRPVAAKAKLTPERVAEARQRMRDERRALLYEVPSHASMLSRRREMGEGTVYVAILGAVYGPPGSIDAAAAMPAAPEEEPAEQRELEPDIPW